MPPRRYEDMLNLNSAFCKEMVKVRPRHHDDLVAATRQAISKIRDNANSTGKTGMGNNKRNSHRFAFHLSRPFLN